MEAEPAAQRDERPPGTTRGADDAVLVALLAGLLWGVADALRVGADPPLSIAAATSVAGLMLGTRFWLQSCDWLDGVTPATIAGALVAVGPLGVFGRMLAASTHHRPLGAATFAVVAVVVVISCVALTLRVFALSQGTSWERRVTVFVGSAGVVSLAFGLWQANDLHLAAAVIVSLGALRLAMWLVPKLALVERLRSARLAMRLAFGTLCVAAIWLASEPMQPSPVSIPLGLWALALQN